MSNRVISLDRIFFCFRFSIDTFKMPDRFVCGDAKCQAKRKITCNLNGCMMYSMKLHCNDGACALVRPLFIPNMRCMCCYFDLTLLQPTYFDARSVAMALNHNGIRVVSTVQAYKECETQ